MSTTPTNLPVPSEKPQDLKFNAGKIDEFVTSLQREYEDRFGNKHYTIEGLRWIAQQAIAAFGYITMDSFQDGATLTLPNQVLRDETDGEYYRWDGVLPKTVPVGSTPESTGGVGVGAWISVGDAALRADLSGVDGYSFIGELKSVSDFFGLVKLNADRVRLRSWYSSWNDSPTGAGYFIFNSSMPKASHDGGVVISPTVPYSTVLSDYVTGVGETDLLGTGCWVRDMSGVTELTSDMYGINNGLTAHADAFQKLSNAASKWGKNIKLCPGEIHLEKTCTINSIEGKAQLPLFIGSGVSQTHLSLYPLGTDQYTLSVSAPVNSEQEWVMSDMRVQEGGGSTRTAYGISLSGLNKWTIERVRFAYFYRAGVFSNCIFGKITMSSCHGGVLGFTFNAAGAGETNPNVITLDNIGFTSLSGSAVQIYNGTHFLIKKCSIEGCGTDGEISFRGIRYFNGGADGGIGLTVEDCYFESNLGYNIEIQHGVNRSVRHRVSNNVFNVTSATRFVSGHILVSGLSFAYTTGIKMTLDCLDNVFWAMSVYTPSSSRPNISINGYTASGIDHCDFNDINNIYIAGEGVASDTVVARYANAQFSFEAKISASGTVSNSRNVTSASKSGTGIYVISANHTITGNIADAQIVGAPGSAIIGAEASVQTLTVRTYNPAGTLTDIDFYIRGYRK